MSAQSPFRLDRNTRPFLFKWGIALLVPVLVYTFLWQGDSVINGAFLGLLYPNNSTYAVAPVDRLVQALFFSVLFYLAVVAFGGYLVAVDSGRRSSVAVWVDVLLYAIVPIILISQTNNLVIGIALSSVVWGVYFLFRNILRTRARRLLLDKPFPSTSDEKKSQRVNIWLILAVGRRMARTLFGLTLVLTWLVDLLVRALLRTGIRSWLVPQ